MNSSERATGTATAPSGSLPAWSSILAVVAHPDDESFGLGAVLAAFAAHGALPSVLCFTHGEASTLHGAAGDLHDVRSRELAAAAEILGISTATLLHYPDGRLADICGTRLAGDVLDAARTSSADALLTFDAGGVTGHPDHVAATVAALTAGDLLGLPVLAWTVPTEVAETLNAERHTQFTGTASSALDYVIRVDRTQQHRAIAAHASQALPSSVLWRRLELLGDIEHLRLLRRAGREWPPVEQR